MLIIDLYQNDILVLCYSPFPFHLSGLIFISIQNQMTEVCLFVVANWWAKEVGPDILIVLGPTPVIEWVGDS